MYVKIIEPYSLNEYDEDNFDDDINNKFEKSKLGKLTLYEREMRNMKRRNEKIEKKRQQLIYEEKKELLPGPEMNTHSSKLISQKEYIPIQERAAKIHSMKITQRILNEERNKIKKLNEELEIMSRIKKKDFNKKEWEKFVEEQYRWNDERQYKIKAAKIFRDNVDKKYLYKPKINSRSKSIIKEMQYGNDSLIDEVFVRLFNDYEEHKERQKLRNEQSLPSFKPKISKNSSQKILSRNLKMLNKSKTNSAINFMNDNNIENMKKQYSINNINKKIIPQNIKAKSQKLFINSQNNNNFGKNINMNKPINTNSNNRQLIKTTQGPTQPTNNTNSNNYTEANNNDLMISKFTILENPLIRSIQKKNFEIKKKEKEKEKRPFLPSSIKNMIEKNSKEPEDYIEPEEKQEGKEDSFNNNDIIENNISKYDIEDNLKINDYIKNYNYINNNNFTKISEKSNYEEGISDYTKSHYDDNNEDEINNKKINYKESEEKENEDYYNVDIDEIDEESTNKKLPNVNKQNSNIFEKLDSSNNLNKTKKFYGQSQEETLNSEDSKFGENNLYKLNIRNCTPQIVRQDVIIPSKEYFDFFDIADKNNNI